jgi:TPR repeat protein
MQSTGKRYGIAVALALTANALTAIAQPATFEALYARESRDNGRDTVKGYVDMARSGNCAAAKRLGEIYDHGLLGISRDYAESLKWYLLAQKLDCSVGRPQAAAAGPPSAQQRADLLAAAATLDAEGKGAEAVDAYTRAARSGSCEAGRRLGEIYEQGLLGVSRDYGESLKWFSFARTLGCEVTLPTPRAKRG